MAKTKEPGPGLWLSIIIATIGGVLASVGSYVAFTSAFELINEDSFETPGEQTRTLDPGEYEIYTLAGSMSFRDFDFELTEGNVGLDQITVTNEETGGRVDLEPLFTTELGRSNNVYEGTASFEVVTKGRYTVAIDSNGESRAIFGRSIESAFDRIIPWLIATVIGVVLFVLGTIMLIVGLVRRKRHRDRGNTLPPTTPDNLGPAPQVPAMGQPQPGDPGTSSPSPAAQQPPPQPPPPRPNDTATPW